MSPSSQNRDIVVIGASAGGVEALSELIASLPPDLPATLFIAQHLSPSHSSHLPELLTARSSWRALHPVHGQEIAPQQIYIAPPDMQLFVRPGYVDVTRGPKENNHRPSVDALFRTAARAYGPRVVGVVLTGHLDCGTAGLLSIRARGGVAVVQDPKDAYAPDMPASAVRHVRVEHVAPLSALGPLIAELVRAPAGPSPTTVPQAVIAMEGEEPGTPAAGIVCPGCSGALTEASIGDFLQYRCHVGHTYSAAAMLNEQNEDMERALWASVRALEESAGLAARMATRSTGNLRARYEEKRETLMRQADLVRSVLLSPDGSPSLPLPGVAS